MVRGRHGLLLNEGKQLDPPAAGDRFGVDADVDASADGLGKRLRIGADEPETHSVGRVRPRGGIGEEVILGFEHDLGAPRLEEVDSLLGKRRGRRDPGAGPIAKAPAANAMTSPDPAPDWRMTTSGKGM